MRFYEQLEQRELLTADVAFRYSSDLLTDADIGRLEAGDTQLSPNTFLYEPLNYNSVSFSPDGEMVSVRQAGDGDWHTQVGAIVDDNPCFVANGLYTRPQTHYRIGFDIRYPEVGSEWLNDHSWSIVMQTWGPRESGEASLNPPFSIYSRSLDGEPNWIVAARADNRPISVDRDYSYEVFASTPMTSIGAWQHWDVELVPNAVGGGLVRAWVNGELVMNEVDVEFGYNAQVNGVPLGPLNPLFGLYAPLVGERMTAFYDNMEIGCSGNYERSVAGSVSGAHPGTSVIALSHSTGQLYETPVNATGVYSMNLSPGTYSLRALDPVTGAQQILGTSLVARSQLLDFDLGQSITCEELEGTRTYGGQCFESELPPENPQIAPAPAQPETPVSWVQNRVCRLVNGSFLFGDACVAAEDINDPSPVSHALASAFSPVSHETNTFAAERATDEHQQDVFGSDEDFREQALSEVLEIELIELAAAEQLAWKSSDLVALSDPTDDSDEDAGGEGETNPIAAEPSSVSASPAIANSDLKGEDETTELSPAGFKLNCNGSQHLRDAIFCSINSELHVSVAEQLRQTHSWLFDSDDEDQ